jgi:hypothetical protein
MSITNRTATNTVTGETITFLETSAEAGGVRVVAEITLTPGGSVVPHSHRVSESFECLDGSFITHLAGKETEFLPGQRMIAEPMRCMASATTRLNPRPSRSPLHPLATWTVFCARSEGWAAMACWCPVSLLGLPLLWRVLPGGAATISRRYPDGFTG